MAKTDAKKQSDTRNVFAYTEQAHGDHVAGYVSVNRCADGSYWLTARASGSLAITGLRVPEDQLKQFAESILAELA